MRRILLADSDPHILLLCRDELQDEGFEVLTVRNGREVLESLQNGCPDLVVLEVLLPDVSGFEILRQIHGFCPQTPVVFHSIYGLPEQHCLPPVVGAVVKTHDLRGLKNLVRRLLPAKASGPLRAPRKSGADISPQRVAYGHYGN